MVTGMRFALSVIMHIEYQSARGCPKMPSMNESQPLSQFKINLNARRDELGLEVKDVAAEMTRRGFDLAYSTVAGWFNSNRGKRWDVKELEALLDVLKTDLKSMAGDGAELVEAKIPALTARAMSDLSESQQQAILAMVRSMKGG